MKSSWFGSFRDIDWKGATGSSASIASGAKALWQRLAGAAPTEAEATAGGTANAETLAAIEVRVRPLAKRIADQDQELRASFEVVNSMAQQHSRLVEAVDLLLARTQVLLRVCAGLGAASVALLVLILVRW